MAEFSKEQMLDELRTIFLFEADHVLISSGPTKAAAFIGFPPGDKGEYVHEQASKVDLSLFADITGSFERAYEFVFNRSRLNAFGEHEVQDLQVFMEGTPRVGGISSGGEMHRFMTPDGYCRAVADAALARWKLEWAGDESAKFTTRELALLANMSEGAVRMAIADKTEGRLKAIPGSKPVAVDFAEAKRWLSGRRGFAPWPERAADDRLLARAIRDAETPKELSRLIGQIAGIGAADRLANVLGWPAADLQPWLDGSFSFDVERAGQVAEALELDVPMFVGKALEVTLRTPKGGR
ncbi:hypothetical protein IP86_17585 [Rhodopseudomonas sp. AAP120]|uniref:hypothetical protein n=1 Tax=Rhodopseudomonas TaxID=1073 RepID=UPI000164BE3A|nr:MULTISPECIES: hypothetical protein [Rhodopseudomonas]ACE99676.1 hypothetical protein Rpal_1135 [Rhodopseudomonas palustris TIE-1]KPF96219.1 hypothetical protein IP86_17585 [Rhodopseudomonas sp. AAP120]